MKAEMLIRLLEAGNFSLDLNQQQNIYKLKELSDLFSSRASIKNNSNFIVNENTIILESGHQPNFFPFSGVWKKAFMLDYIMRCLKSQKKDVCAFYAFADLNLSTADYLYGNKIPDYNKKGSLNIGFIRNKKEKWNSFCTVKKPDQDLFLKELEKIKKHYLIQSEKTKSCRSCFGERTEHIIKIFEESYNLATSFSEFNAFLFAKICKDIFDINVLFYNHSDLQKNYVFMNEWIRILKNRENYNKVYNQTINDNRLDIKPVKQNFVPFWYECKCGCKIPVNADKDGRCRINCFVCKREEEFVLSGDFSDLKKHFSCMSLTAVTRDIVHSEGIGTSLLITGCGGSRQYGRVSGNIASAIGFNHPFRLSWNSSDYYIGMTHLIALEDFLKAFRLKTDVLKSKMPSDAIVHEINLLKQKADSQNNSEDRKKEHKTLLNRYNLLLNVLSGTKNVFSNRYSALDLFINENTVGIKNLWEKTLEESGVSHEIYSKEIVLSGDVIYSPFEMNDEEFSICRIYQDIFSLEAE